MKIVIPRIIENRKQLKWDWSGSVTNLKKSLEKIEVIEEKNIFFSFKMKMNVLFEKIHFRRNDFNLSNIKIANKKIDLKPEDVCLTFDEFPLDKKCKNIYIYQDLSVGYLLDLEQSRNKKFESSGYCNISHNALKRRNDYQLGFYENVAGVFTMSKWLASYLVNFQNIPSAKVHYVGAGINIKPELIDYSRKNRKRFLFIGKDFYRKSGDLVYNAFDFLQKNYMSDAELYIIGPDISPINITNSNVHFLGNLPSERVKDYYNLCDVFVMPSRFEAFGIVFVEALSYGLPCIGRNLMEMPNFIEHGKTGRLISEYEENYVKLADEMFALIKDESAFENVKLLRDSYISEFSWDTVAKKMVRVMEENYNS